ncbi:peptidylprolyl isomerase [Pontibaca salina]|uniref:Parvulin-like PPIase n=1 Tax=Pontibaca salina TaxID=2795731 RepID=A0A934HRR7_9RHOB|nr:peptidylprolyl isomerase [Pontibaca salina]MBI6629355.1 peptidylprolyl isomerase [Pontibaca salina]
MPKGLTFLSAIAVAVSLGLPAAAEAAFDADTVVARVNGDEITLGHMVVAYETLPAQYRQAPAEMLFDAIREQLIQQSALKQAHSGDIPKVVELALENERRSLLAADVLESVMMNAASDADIQAAYDQRFGDGDGGEEFNAAHILVETKAAAEKIKSRLDKGADFAALAKDESTGPTGPNGGELGWFQKGTMVPEFEEAVVAMEPGEISEPVHSQFGWHIVKLNERRTAEAPELDDVRDDIANDLRSAAVEAKIEELTANATVERPVIEGFDPEILADGTLIGN